MYPAIQVSLSCLVIAILIGLLFWYVKYDIKRRKKRKEEALKQRVRDLTGRDFVKGYTTVKDLEKTFGKKG